MFRLFLTILSLTALHPGSISGEKNGYINDQYIYVYIRTVARYASVTSPRGLTRNAQFYSGEYPVLLSVRPLEARFSCESADICDFDARRRISNSAAVDLCPPEGITSRCSTRSPALGRLLTAQYSTGSCFASPALILAKVSDEQAGVTSNVHYFRPPY